MSTELSKQEILEQLTRIEVSSTFANLKDYRVFLRFVIQESLAGRSAGLNASSIAKVIYPMRDELEGANDIRSLASRLRKALLDYYHDEGKDQPIEIDIPKKSYRPVFRNRLTSPLLRVGKSPQILIAQFPPVNRRLIGREKERAVLDAAWLDPSIRLVSIVTYGGVGKTALVFNWCRDHGVPDATRVLGWSFYSQGSNIGRQETAEPFLEHALTKWFRVAPVSSKSWQQGEQLSELIRDERILLLLDGLEAIQAAETERFGLLKDPGLVALLRNLAAQNPGLCICTSRLPLSDLVGYEGAGVLEPELDNLSPTAGARYLKELGVGGSDEQRMEASIDFGNHALALTLLGRLLVTRLGGDVVRRDTIPGLLDDPEKGGHARRIFRAYERLFTGRDELAVLRLMGLFDRPADPGAIRALRVLPTDLWSVAVENLRSARLIEFTKPEGPLDCHPLTREYFENEYRSSEPSSFESAHAQLYSFYANQAVYRPGSLKAMQPLVHAVYHGCQAQMFREAYSLLDDRILRFEQVYLWKQLGAFGTYLSLLGHFFASRWNTPQPILLPAEQAHTVSRAGFALLAMGRLADAIEPLQLGADLYQKEPNWLYAALSFQNLSQGRLAGGDIEGAIRDAKTAVRLATKSKNKTEQIMDLAALANALHQAGEVASALKSFQDAEALQAEERPEFPFLNILYGYYYCDLLLSLGRPSEVVERATRSLKRPANILATALDHLALGRALPPESEHTARHLDEALEGLQHYESRIYVPLGFLARAKRSSDTEDYSRAERDLAAVHFVAKQCGMLLHLADYNLLKAEIEMASHREASALAHVATAEKLIDQTSYLRRLDQLRRLREKLK